MVLITKQVKKYSKFEKHNPKIALVVLYVDVDVKVFKYNDREYADINKPIKRAYFLNIILKEKKKGVLSLISDDISIQDEVVK